MDQATPTRPRAIPASPIARAKIVWLLASLVVAITLMSWDELGQWWERISFAFGTPEEFRSWVEGLGAWGPIAYLLAQAAQVVVVPVPGTLFPPVGALAFGPWPALGLSIVGLALGSALVFLIARRWGRPLGVRVIGTERLQRYQNVIAARGGLLLWLVFLLPLLPLLPDDAVCVLAGLSTISFRRFMLIAVFGRLPAVAAGVFGMAGLEGAPAWVWAAAVAGFGLVVFAGIRYGPSLERRLVGRISRNDRVTTSE